MGRPTARGPLALAVVILAVASAGCGDGKRFEGSGEAGAGGSGGSGAAGSGGTGGSQGPADVSGTYTVALTVVDRRLNFMSCPLSSVMVGSMSTNVMVTITQSGSILTASVDWITGLGVAELLGVGVTFAGSVTGNDVEMVAFGTKMYTEGACTYTMNAIMNGTLVGNALEGTTRYDMVPDAGTTCRDLTCEAAQEFSGSRPPR